MKFNYVISKWWNTILFNSLEAISLCMVISKTHFSFLSLMNWDWDLTSPGQFDCSEFSVYIKFHLLSFGLVLFYLILLSFLLHLTSYFEIEMCDNVIYNWIKNIESVKYFFKKLSVCYVYLFLNWCCQFDRRPKITLG